MGSMGPRFLSAGLLVLDAGLLVISDSFSFVRGPVKKHTHTNTPFTSLLSGPLQITENAVKRTRLCTSRALSGGFEAVGRNRVSAGRRWQLFEELSQSFGATPLWDGPVTHGASRLLGKTGAHWPAT